MNVKPVAYDSGLSVHLMAVDRNALKDEVEPMVYELTPTKTGPKLDKIKKQFEMPPRLFGTKIYKNAELIVSGFENTKKPLGAMGIGQKGTGKTEQMQLICNKLLAKGIPIIMVRTVCSRLDIEMAIRMCSGTGCVIFFDEYGKVYTDHEENSEAIKNELLTMFSDTSLGKVLYLLTDNSTRMFNDFILERPTRIRYRFDYNGCSEDIVEDICKLNKLTPEITTWVKDHTRKSHESIDGVLAICSEGKKANNLGEFIDLFKILNVIKPKYPKVSIMATNDSVTCTVKDGNIVVCEDGKEIKTLTLGKHPLVGIYPSHDFGNGNTKVRVNVIDVSEDPGNEYTPSVGSLRLPSGGMPW